MGRRHLHPLAPELTPQRRSRRRDRAWPPTSGCHRTPGRRARFEREAKLLTSLNHSNITTIHGLHEVEGVHFIAMELAGGKDLARRLARGPLPLDEALIVGREVAEALEAAHERGVVHRDLKPANVALVSADRVEILDFGLAKALEWESPLDPSRSPTLTSGGTGDGVILGTAAYMSPEQARGRPVDRRADIWAFGCLLYETLAGKRAFPGRTVSDTLVAVLSHQPDWRELPPGTPPRVRWLLERCLTKAERRRLRDIGEARIVMEDVIAGDTGAVVETPALVGRRPSAARWVPAEGGEPRLAAADDIEYSHPQWCPTDPDRIAFVINHRDIGSSTSGPVWSSESPTSRRRRCWWTTRAGWRTGRPSTSTCRASTATST